MANSMATSVKKLILDADLDLLVDTIKCVLLTNAYTFSSAHDFLDDVGAGTRIATATLASKTTTGGVFDSADPVFPAVAAGSTVARYWLYKDTGADATSPLIAFYDTNASSAAISVPTNGSDFTLILPTSGWFTI